MTQDLILILKKKEKETKRMIVIMNDDERYWKRNWNKMVSYRDKVVKKQRDRKRKEARKT